MNTISKFIVYFISYNVKCRQTFYNCLFTLQLFARVCYYYYIYWFWQLYYIIIINPFSARGGNGHFIIWKNKSLTYPYTYLYALVYLCIYHAKISSQTLHQTSSVRTYESLDFPGVFVNTKVLQFCILFHFWFPLQ